MADQTLEPFATGSLDVGDGHVLYYEQVGSSEGTPVVYLHGGPGSGCTPEARRNFDPQRHRAVLFDQRAAGRSTPHASGEDVHWASTDMSHHVGDIEQLREQLGIERWIVFGLSWGSVLGATYAERHPDRVSALVLGAVSTGTSDDIDWLTVHAGRFFPAEWRQFRDHVPVELRKNASSMPTTPFSWIQTRQSGKPPQVPGAGGRTPIWRRRQARSRTPATPI